MTIYKSKTFIETYRLKALSKDINELTGRTGRPDLTKFVADQLAKKLKFKTDSVVVDIGCGDGTFLQKASEYGVNSFKGRLIGILPNKEEVARIREHLSNIFSAKNDLISIEPGMLSKVNLPDEFADIVVSNSTFHILSDQTNVLAALKEINRVCKKSGVIFIGELPAANEMTGRNYGDSITAWLLWILKTQGVRQFLIRLKQTLVGSFSGEPFIISPKELFFMPPHHFIKLLESYGFQILEYYKHKEIDCVGNVCDSATRWDYLAYKI